MCHLSPRKNSLLIGWNLIFLRTTTRIQVHTQKSQSIFQKKKKKFDTLKRIKPSSSIHDNNQNSSKIPIILQNDLDSQQVKHTHTHNKYVKEDKRLHNIIIKLI